MSSPIKKYNYTKRPVNNTAYSCYGKSLWQNYQKYKKEQNLLEQYPYAVPHQNPHKVPGRSNIVKPIKKAKKKKVKQKQRKSLIAAFFAACFLGAYSYYVCPYNFENYFRPVVLNRILNHNLKFDAKPYVNPTADYVHNSYLLGEYLLVPPAKKSKELSSINMVSELSETKAKLLDLFKYYPRLKPSVFVWEYSTGRGLEINADEIYPAASIIKIPIAIELMRLIDRSSTTNEPISLTDKRVFDESYRTLGSGYLQRVRAGNSYSLDYLANIMITNSDNSATNMILNEIGGVDNFNRSMRNYSLKTTAMKNWLPDLEGDNKTTAREMSEILYNIDNPSYLNPKYKSVLHEYMGNTRNTHLLKEKLPFDTLILHKTGNIATMLGDSGIVYTNSGGKYIVTILVKRPKNDYGAKLLIQDASLIIYNDLNRNL